MATTTGTGAKKIAGTDDWRDIFDIHNDTVDAYDGKIGTTVLPTTAQTLSGAIGEQNEAIANKIIFGSVTTITGNGTTAAITKDANNANLPNLTNYKTLTFELSVGDINNPPADITVTRANGSYTLTIANYGGTSFTVQPIFGCN